MRRSFSAVVYLSMLLGPTIVLPVASFANTFGIGVFDGGTISCGYAGCGGVPSGGVSSPTTNLELNSLTFNDSFSLVLAGATSSLRLLTSLGSERTVSQTFAPGGNYSVSSNADSSWFDTIDVLGPTGQTGEFEVDLSFQGTMTVTGNPVIGDAANILYLTVGGHAIDSGLNHGLGVGPGLQTVPYFFNWTAGSSNTIGELLTIRNLISGNGGVTIDDFDTGFFTVTALTPGFSYTTASGFDYSPASATPEPSSLLFLGTGLVGLGGAAKRKFFS